MTLPRGALDRGLWDPEQLHVLCSAPELSEVTAPCAV